VAAPRRISVTFYDEKDKSEKTVRAPLGQSLMEAAHANDVDLEGGSCCCPAARWPECVPAALLMLCVVCRRL